MLEPTSCGAAHDYVVVATVSDARMCPTDSPYYVELSVMRIGCLKPAR
jgi:hypothetical protein